MQRHHTVQNKYLAFTTVNLNVVDKLCQLNLESKNYDEIQKLLPIDVNDNSLNWYCHKIFRPRAFHFCCAIAREDLADLNGFDERYANGIEMDDVEFLTRIIRKKMNIIFINIIVIHQSHVPFYYLRKDLKEKQKVATATFQQYTQLESNIPVNQHKKIIK